MDQCEFLDICYFAKNVKDNEQKEAYCDSNSLRCARFMIYKGVGEDKVPNDLQPNEKMKAYEILAEN